MDLRTNYLAEVFCPKNFVKTVDKAANFIIKWCRENDKAFDAIAFSGMSGAALAFPLALKLNKPMLLVRKPDDSTHSYEKIEGDHDVGSYLIVDDFICTGNTIRRIMDDINEYVRTKPKCVGVYLYRSSGVCLNQRDGDGSDSPKTINQDEYPWD